MKKSILLTLVILIASFSYSQDKIKMQVKNGKIAEKAEAAGNTKFKSVKTTLSYDFKIKSPSDKATVNNNAPIEGTAMPGSLIKIEIDSRYLPFNGTNYKTGPSQSFYATANKSGKWKTDPVDFQIVKSNYSKVEYSIRASEESGNKTTKSVVYAVANSSGAVSLFEITKPIKLTAAPPDEMAFVMPRNVGFKIEGKGSPGSKIIVDVSFDGTTERVDWVILIKNVHTSHQDRKKLDSWELTVNSDGTWKTPLIEPYKEWTEDKNDTSYYYKRWISQVYATVKVIDNDKEVVIKKLILPCAL